MVDPLKCCILPWIRRRRGGGGSGSGSFKINHYLNRVVHNKHKPITLL